MVQRDNDLQQVMTSSGCPTKSMARYTNPNSNNMTCTHRYISIHHHFGILSIIVIVNNILKSFKNKI